MTMVCLNSVYCVCFKIIAIWIFGEIGNGYTPVIAWNQIQICNTTLVVGEAVMIHSYNVSRSISSCSCSVKLPTGVDEVHVDYTIQRNRSQNCSIKFSLDNKPEFLCEPKSVNRTSLTSVQFSRDRIDTKSASLQIKVGSPKNVSVQCGKNISEDFSRNSDDSDSQEEEKDEENEEMEEDTRSAKSKPIHVCDSTTVKDQRVILHNFNVSRSIDVCACSVALPTGTNKVTVSYSTPQRRKVCGIKFLLDSTQEFLCDANNVTRANLTWVQFSRDRSSTAMATLQINVEDNKPATVRCGLQITKYSDYNDDQENASDKEEETNDGADGGLPDPTKTVPEESASRENTYNNNKGVIIGGSVSAVVVAVIIGGLFYTRRHFRNRVKKEDSVEITEESAMHPRYSKLDDVTVTMATNGDDAVVTYNAMYNQEIPDTVPNAHHTDENSDLVVTYNAMYNVDIPITSRLQGQSGVKVKDTAMQSADRPSKIYHEIKDGEVCITTATANQVHYGPKTVASAGKERPSQIYHDINVYEMEMPKQSSVQTNIFTLATDFP